MSQGLILYHDGTYKVFSYNNPKDLVHLFYMQGDRARDYFFTKETYLDNPERFTP